MNYLDNDDDMNLDDAMYLDRMSHLKVQVDEKTQEIIDSVAEELFESNNEDLLMARFQIVDVPDEKSIKQVIFDDNFVGHLITQIDMTKGVPSVSVQFEKTPAIKQASLMESNETKTFGFNSGEGTA